MSSAPQPPFSPAEIVADARWLAQALDAQSGMLRVVEMDQEAYRSESFLDDRMLQKPHFAGVVPWATVAEAVPSGARTDARWIFHIGHVGSTLLARLLGEIDGVLPVREPRVLRDVAMLPKQRRPDFVPALQALLSRTFAGEEIALVKATSFVSEIAAELVPPGERTLLMYASPRNYVASILAGPNSVQELAALAPSRAERAKGRVELCEPQSAAEAAAAAWACEMTSLEAAAEGLTNRHVAWADFDEMLGDMPNELLRVAQFFGFEAAAERIHAIATGPLMRRYSKALEYDYSPELRRELIDDAATRHRGEMESALAMLHKAAEKSPLLMRALERSKEN